MNNLDRIPYYTRIQSRVKSCFNPQILEPQKMRAFVMGTMITAIAGEVTAYKLIQQNIRAGELNMYTADFIIIGISMLEVLVGHFVSWFGYNQRRRVALLWNVGVTSMCLMWFALPAVTNREESEYCHGSNFNLRDITVTSSAIVRLCLILASCVMFCLARVAVWCHCIAYIDQYAPARTGMHFGILVIIRVIPLLVGDKMVTSGLESNLTIHLLGLFGSSFGNIVQVFLFIPRRPPTEEESFTQSNRGFIASLNRVFRNTSAMSQMVGIGLLAAALWGFAFHEGDIVKVTYHIDVEHRQGLVANLLQVMRYLVVIMSVVYVGVKFSAPILEVFCRFRVIKQATKMSIIALVFYILLVTISKCERGSVAGLNNNHYNQPSCSVACGCAPRWSEFEPVCVVDQVTTYLSPCQAGCSSSILVHNIKVYTNCTCAPGNGPAALGACSLDDCYQSHQMHQVFFMMVVLATVLALQAQGLLILRTVDGRDKSLALGVASAIVSMLTFVCGHGIFLGISAATCRWYAGGRCHLHSERLPVYIASASAAMVFLAISINVYTWVYWKVADRRKKSEDLAKKPWQLLRKYILTIPRFDLFLQGTLLIVTLLEANVFLLIRRNDSSGYIRSINEDWVTVGAGGAQFLLGAVVAFYGSSRRHFALSGWLAITSICSLIVLAFPFADSDPPSVKLCGGDSISAYSSIIIDGNKTPRTVFLVLTAILCSLAKISVWAHGLTYLDDHEPQNGPYFYGILISIQLSLGLNGWSWLQPGSLRDDWWEAHVSVSCLTLMFAILFTLFPKRMPDYKELDEGEDTALWPTLLRLFGNKVFMLQSVAISLLHAALFSFIDFDDEYIQARFHVETIRQDPRTSRAINDIFRSLVIIFFVTVFRVRFSMRRSDGVKASTASRVGGVVAIFVAIFFSVLTALGCDLDTIAGVNGEYTQPDCSLDCGCNSENYGFSPVCMLDSLSTYFSPCHAGCNQYEDLNGFVLLSNCTCGIEKQRAIRGHCRLSSCQSTYSFYLLFFTLVLAVAGASCVMQGMVILRSVKRCDKPVAVGVSFAIIAVLAHVLAHLFYMMISHLTCAYKHNSVCLLHHPTLWTMGLTSVVLTLSSAAVSIAVSIISRPGSGRENGSIHIRY
ncbi:uncharacterized protein [Epargyreus clarus]|uniref:uncharacterized protein n=1 Tax=Epargyreus clarus TaxID=520877 RepID=UPI003C2DA753